MEESRIQKSIQENNYQNSVAIKEEKTKTERFNQNKLAFIDQLGAIFQSLEPWVL